MQKSLLGSSLYATDPGGLVIIVTLTKHENIYKRINKFRVTHFFSSPKKPTLNSTLTFFRRNQYIISLIKSFFDRIWNYMNKFY